MFVLMTLSESAAAMMRRPDRPKVRLQPCQSNHRLPRIDQNFHSPRDVAGSEGVFADAGGEQRRFRARLGDGNRQCSK